jgi:hypothetical protein
MGLVLDEMIHLQDHGELALGRLTCRMYHFSVGIASSKARGIGSLIVIGDTTSGLHRQHVVWPSPELNLIDQARHWRAMEKHKTLIRPYQGTCSLFATEICSMGHPGLSWQRYEQAITRGRNLFSVLHFSGTLWAPRPSEQIPGWTHRGGVA